MSRCTRCDGDDLLVVHDPHPQYVSDDIALGSPAAELGGAASSRAHRLRLAERERLGTGEVIGVSFDGTGYGDDGTIWGGEIFRWQRARDGFERVAHLRTAMLPGGDVRRPISRASRGWLSSQVDNVPDLCSAPFIFLRVITARAS